MARNQVLIVEDERKIAQILSDYLTAAGFTASILHRGDQVIAQVRREPPALILLDIMLPGMEGTDICREIRRFSAVPIIMITARVEEIERIVGLELGADDYICKPFSPREVVARVKAVLRRTRAEPGRSAPLEAGPIFLDEARREASAAGHPLNLTPSEFGLLKILMAQPGRVFSRNELINRVQGYAFDGYDRTIDTHIKNLRKKIAAGIPDQEVIRTVYGVGYKFSLEPEDL
ncbi:response regulator [Desulfatiglans anilini]|uniref:response regulator n=1 Tax=Desulfatiglans anilini TaxID=90728 RepID=UPI0003FAAAE5|nr:response regulator [Desulfatiglans anilini]